MKTKIRLLIIICTLGLVGVLNANATLSYKTSARTLVVEENAKSDNLNSTEFIFNEDTDAAIDYQNEAQLLTKWVADKEEAKTIQMLTDKSVFVWSDQTDSFSGETKTDYLNSAEFIFNKDADAAIDYQKEAQLLTKWVADREEAKVVQKLIDEGVFAENK